MPRKRMAETVGKCISCRRNAKATERGLWVNVAIGDDVDKGTNINVSLVLSDVGKPIYTHGT